MKQIKLPTWQDSWRNLAEQALKRPLSEKDVQVLRDAYQKARASSVPSPDIITGIVCPLTGADGMMLEISIQMLATENYGWHDSDTTWECVVDFNLVGKDNTPINNRKETKK